MPSEIRLIKVGMTMTEGAVAEWYVPDGGTVAKGEPLYRLETEKVSLDVEAPVDGTLRHVVPAEVTIAPVALIGLLYAPGEEVPEGPVATAGTPGASSTLAAPPGAGSHGADARPPSGAEAAVRSAPDGRTPSSPGARRLAAELGVALDAVHGSGPGGRIVEADIRAAHEVDLAGAASTPATPSAAPASSVSPRVRRVAKRLGVDVSLVPGSGEGGRLLPEDVEAAAAAATGQKRGDASASPAGSPWNHPAGQRIPLRGMRRTIAERMLDSLQTTAQLTITTEVGMDEAVRLRARLVGEWAADGVRASYTDLVVKAAATALCSHPRMNAWLVEDQITLLDEVGIGIAVALDEGLVVPVLRDPDRRSLREIASESSRLAMAARDGTLGLDEMSGGSFTVTTLGMYGVDSFTPILNAPQVGILGVGRIRDGVGWDGDLPIRRQTMTLSLTWDHRALDGVPAAEFLAAVRDLLEEPERLLP